MKKKQARQRRAKKTRVGILKSGRERLCVHKTPRHIYAQLISSDGNKTLATASTLQAEISDQLKSTGNVEAAKAVGASIAKKAIEAGIEQVAFDRSGFKYHGRVKALAESARESGLKI
ncbi:MAG: 50S ribosomal protein L18 [Gammaproteobacteria bacterium]|nr:MAG: 50S ribosomal protein L18 [Gammaproteobacteria bacterium]